MNDDILNNMTIPAWDRRLQDFLDTDFQIVDNTGWTSSEDLMRHAAPLFLLLQQQEAAVGDVHTFLKALDQAAFRLDEASVLGGDSQPLSKVENLLRQLLEKLGDSNVTELLKLGIENFGREGAFGYFTYSTLMILPEDARTPELVYASMVLAALIWTTNVPRQMRTLRPGTSVENTANFLDLVDLLSANFTGTELRLLARHLELTAWIPGEDSNASVVDLSLRLVEAVEHRGLLPDLQQEVSRRRPRLRVVMNAAFGKARPR